MTLCSIEDRYQVSKGAWHLSDKVHRATSNLMGVAVPLEKLTLIY